jgi:uncharacterized protein (DUF983 family)
MAATVPLATPGLAAVLGRALRLRCPRCGRTALFTGWFAMRDACPACGLRYEREQGYFVGAIYVNYALTAIVGLGGVLLLDGVVGLSLVQQLALAIPIMLLAPLLFFRHARSLWLGIGFLLGTLDERAARQAARRSRS